MAIRAHGHNTSGKTKAACGWLRCMKFEKIWRYVLFPSQAAGETILALVYAISLLERADVGKRGGTSRKSLTQQSVGFCFGRKKESNCTCLKVLLGVMR